MSNEVNIKYGEKCFCKTSVMRTISKPIKKFKLEINYFYIIETIS